MATAPRPSASCSRSSRRIGHGFRALGLVPGDHVAMALPNLREFLEVLLAAMEIGPVVTPLNTHLAAGEVAHVLADSDAQVFVAHEALADIAEAAAVEAGLDLGRCFAVGSIDGFAPYACWRPARRRRRRIAGRLADDVHVRHDREAEGRAAPPARRRPRRRCSASVAVFTARVRRRRSSPACTSCAARCTTPARSRVRPTPLHVGQRRWC